MLKKQRGITLIGFIFAVAGVIAAGIVSMKVVPVYLNHYAVVRSMKALDELPKQALDTSSQMAKSYLREYLSRKLYINEIRFISKRDMKIKRKRKAYIVSVAYTVEKNLISNVYLVFKFNPSYEVSIEGN